VDAKIELIKVEYLSPHLILRDIQKDLDLHHVYGYGDLVIDLLNRFSAYGFLTKEGQEMALFIENHYNGINISKALRGNNDL
jgi:hypothetical protein